MPLSPVPGMKNSGSISVSNSNSVSNDEITTDKAASFRRSPGNQENHRPPSRPSLLTSAINSCPPSFLRTTKLQNDRPRSATISTARRTSPQFTPPYDVAPPAANFYQHQPEVSPTRTEYTSSLPINIPPRQEKIPRPSTPLTGRFDRRPHFPPFLSQTPPQPQISQSLRPNYPLSSTSTSATRTRRRNSPTTPPPNSSPSTTTITTTMQTNHHHPPSPFSPPPPPPTTTPSPKTTPSPRRRPDPYLHLPPLPRFHPAVYQSPSNSALTSPTSARAPIITARSPYNHHRHLSDHQKLQQNLIANVARAAAAVSPVRREMPKAPALVPAGSPGPATPMMLEEGGDYLSIKGEGRGRV